MRFLAKSLLSRFAGNSGDPPPIDAQVGILAFEAARAMSRLVALHRALTPSSLSLLQNTTVPSADVSCLNSFDRLFFLRVVCAEMLDDLDRAASAISRLASRSHSPWPHCFHRLYSDLKSGVFDVDRKFVLPKKALERKLKKMEASISSTSTLYAEMETLAAMEASARRLERWKSYSGPMPAGANQQDPPGTDAFLKKLAAQKRLVDKSKDDSLWRQSTEKTSEYMARAAVTAFLRICEAFGKFFPELPDVDTTKGRYRSRPNTPCVRVQSRHHSGPLDWSRRRGGVAPPITMMKFSGPLDRSDGAAMAPAKTDLRTWSARTLEPPPGTVGAAGLSMRYADLIQLAEKMFQSPQCFGQEDREELYQMLPRSLRAAVRTKLKGVPLLPTRGPDRARLMKTAEGVLSWLAPVANDTSKWFSDRSCEKQRIDPATKVLMVQTLQISDRTKTEEAIVDVLIGLSLVYQRRHGGGER